MFRTLQLRSVLTLVIALLSTTLVALAVVTVGTAGEEFVSEQVGNSLLLLADQMQDKLDRALYERSHEIGLAADLLPRASPDIDTWLRDLQGRSPDYAWVGFISSQGIVRNSAGASARDGNVAQQAWFKAGMKRLSVSDARDESASFLDFSSPAHTPKRHIWISAPVKRGTGPPDGIVAALLDWSWAAEVRDSLFGTVPSPRTEQVFVLSTDHTVLLGPDGFVGRKLDLSSAAPAPSGPGHYALQRWFDGRSYITGIARSDGHRSFAGLGWTVLVRQDADIALAPVHRLRRQTLILSVALAALGLLSAWLAARKISAPILKLAKAAEAIGKGDQVRVPQTDDFAEVSTLSRSLAGLVSGLKDQQDRLTRLNASLEAQVGERTAELVVRNAALVRAQQEAEAATAAKSRFIAAASHDLRQPLHAMTLFARGLSRRVSGEDARHLVDQLELSLAALTRMFDSLLDISRLDAGLIRPHRSIVSVKDILDRLANSFRAEAKAHGLDFKCHSVNCLIFTDSALLETILRNLVANALKFTRTGGVLLAAHRRSGRVAFEVWDTGTGISPEQRDRIFSQFERAQDDARGPNEGLGLGLFIVKTYTALLGGDVRLASRPGRGSSFTVLLPEAVLDDAPQSTVARAPAAANGLPYPLEILLVDDDAEILDAMQRELTDRGCVTRSFTTIGEAEDVLRQGWQPDAAIIDYNLHNGSTGIDALRRLETVCGHIPALIVTGRTDRHTLSTLEASKRPWMVKPTDPDVLAARLKQLAAAERTFSDALENRSLVQ